MVNTLISQDLRWKNLTDLQMATLLFLLRHIIIVSILSLKTFRTDCLPFDKFAEFLSVMET